MTEIIVQKPQKARIRFPLGPRIRRTSYPQPTACSNTKSGMYLMLHCIYYTVSVEPSNFSKLEDPNVVHLCSKDKGCFWAKPKLLNINN